MNQHDRRVKDIATPAAWELPEVGSCFGAGKSYEISAVHGCQRTTHDLTDDKVGLLESFLKKMLDGFCRLHAEWYAVDLDRTCG